MKYRETGYRVPRKSRVQIRKRAQWLRDFIETSYNLAGDAVDVVGVIEKWGRLRADGQLDNPDYRIVEHLICRAAEFKPRDASDETPPITDDDKHVFIIPEETWNDAQFGEPEARETLAHEIGHCVLNHPVISYPRQYHDDRVEWESDSEWQANTFMDEFLMDSRLISVNDGWMDIVVRFNVTEAAAMRRLRELMNERIDTRKKRS